MANDVLVQFNDGPWDLKMANLKPKGVGVSMLRFTPSTPGESGSARCQACAPL